jgi:hypothetical protein
MAQNDFGAVAPPRFSQSLEAIMEISMKRMCFATLLAMTLFGCVVASGPIYSPAQSPTSEQALFYLYRLKTNYGGAVPVKVVVNGKEMGLLPNNSYTSAYVPPGEFNLSATRWQDFHYPDSKRVHVEGVVEGGVTYYFKIFQKGSGIVYTYLERVPPEVAIPELKNLKRAEPEK